MKISDSFKLKDATHSWTAQLEKIDNSKVSKMELERIGDISEYTLEPIVAKYGSAFAIASWYRCELLDGIVGEDPNSEHMMGSEVDLIPLKTSALELAHMIRNSKAEYNKMILEYRDGVECLHLQYRKENLVTRDDYTMFNGRCYPGLLTHEPTLAEAVS